MLLERLTTIGRAVVSPNIVDVCLRSACAAEAALLRRLHSQFTASTSSSSSHCAGNAASQQQLQQHNNHQQQHQSEQQQQLLWPQQHIQQPDFHHHHHHHHLHLQQQQQHNPWNLCSTRSYVGGATGTSSSSSNASSVGRRRRLPGSGSSNSSSSGGGRGGRYNQKERLSPAQLQAIAANAPVGRLAQLCKSTRSLREPTVLTGYDPWRDRSYDSINPLQVDGSRGEDLDNTLLIRQQLENSALPTQLKRSTLIGGPGWDELLLKVNRTVKVTKGGKVETLHALVAVGNADGLIGVGEHSGKNVQKVTMDAQLKAYRNLVAIPRYRKRTVYHPMDFVNRKIRMQVWPRAAGFGITASPLITQLCELAGIQDVTIQVTGRRKNIRNVVHTFVEALSSQQSVPHDGVEGTGVYMREVYHRNSLPCGLRRGVDIP